MHAACNTCNGGFQEIIDAPAASAEAKPKEKKKRRIKTEEDIGSPPEEKEELDLGTTVACSYQTKWLASDEALNTVVGRCKDTPLVLGHSFAAMREREFLLRNDSGVYEKSGTAQGPNNALAEVRLLLVNDQCQVVQLAIRLVDSDNQYLLFRSTGGTLNINPKAEIRRLNERKQMLEFQIARAGDAEGLLAKEKGLIEAQIEHYTEAPEEKWIRCHEIQCVTDFGVGYKAELERYMQVGAYSFYEPDRGETDDRHKTPHLYKTFHEGDYRLLVQAPSNAQQFHHSEQAVFRCLYENTHMLAQVLANAQWYEALRKGGGPPKLLAVSIDMFTTRAACSNCQKASQRVLAAEHFFTAALGAVRTKLADRYQVVKDVKTFVRIDCAYAFGSSEAEGAATSGAGDRLLHVVPRKKADQLKDTSSRYIIYVQFAVEANGYGDDLLSDGTDTRERTLIEQYRDRLLELGKVDTVIDLTEVVHRGLLTYSRLSKKEQILLILYLSRKHAQKTPASAKKEYIRVLKASGVKESLCDLALHVVVAARLVIEKVGGMSPLDHIIVIARNYKGLWNAPVFSNDILLAIIAAYEYVVERKMPENTKLEIIKTLKEEVLKEIKTLIDEEEGSATNENAAMNLAAEFDLWDEYVAYRTST